MLKLLSLLAAMLMLCTPALCEDDEELSLSDILQNANPGVVDSTLTNTPTPVPEPNGEPTPTPTPEPVAYEPDGSLVLTVSAIGNIAIGYDDRSDDSLFSDELIEHGGNYGFFLENVSSILLEDDVTIGAFTGTLTNSTYLPSTLSDDEPIYRLPPSAAQTLLRGGIEAVALDNSHAYAHGNEGFADTQDALRDAGVVASTRAVRGVIPVKGTSICLLSYQVTNPESANVYERLQADITAASREFPAVIVSLHWGDERAYVPSEAQVQLAHFADDQGATLVLGHHPDHIQPIELYNGAYICYSLGNFVDSSTAQPNDMTSFIVQVKLRIRDGKATSDALRIIPIRISSRTERNTLVLTPLTHVTALDSIVAMLLENGKSLPHALTRYPLSW